MSERSKVVKELFENTAHYLKYDYNLTIRRETVEEFTSGHSFESVLDVPCGTGAISISILDRTKELTMVDVSANMISLAADSVPEKHIHKTKIVHADFFDINLPEHSYDLVICLGLLAHVNSPEKLLYKITALLKPGGMLILQNTDASHFYSYLIRFYLGLKNLISKQPYQLNKVSGKFTEKQLKRNNFELVKVYRYNQSFLGLSNLFSNQTKYKLTRKVFGNASYNKNSSLGSDFIYLFKNKKEE